MSLTDNAIPFTFRYVDFTEDGPKEVEETRHFYFNMRVFKRMYEISEVDEEQLETAIESGKISEDEKLPRVSDDDSEEQKGLAAKNIDAAMANLGFTEVVVYAGLLVEAEALGDDLSIEKVSDMMGTLDNMNEAAGAAVQALARFTSGLTEEQQEELEEMVGGEDDSGKAKGRD